MRSGRRGFTLVELMIALILMSVVGTVIYRLVSSTQRVATAQAERMLLQSNVRTGALVVPAELREIATNAAGQTDLVQIAADSVTYRAARGIGFTCAVTSTQVKIRNSAVLPYSGLRGVSAGRDSLLLFVESDPTTAADDRWVRLAVSSVATSTCGSDPAIAVTTPNFLALLPGGLLSTVVVGGPVRVEEVMRLKGYASGADRWVGAQSVSAGESVQPILGPIAANGFRLAYFDSVGATTTVPASVRTIQVTLIGVTERAVARGGNSGPNALIQDTLVTRVMLRNAPR